MDVLPGLYADWDRWACEVANGHTKYPVLNQFRLPRSRHHWLLNLVAMMDAAAVDLAVRRSAPAQPRLFLISAIACANDLATPLHISTESDEVIAVTMEDSTDAIHGLTDAGYDCDIPAADAWLTFVEWRGAHRVLVCRVLDAIAAPEAPWTNGRTLPLHRKDTS
jgi:hypothetical protein